MHALRHTYATRAIEYGMPPKTLQKLLGHASIKTTMDRYVHVSEDFMLSAVRISRQKGKPAELGQNGAEMVRSDPVKDGKPLKIKEL